MGALFAGLAACAPEPPPPPDPSPQRLSLSNHQALAAQDRPRHAVPMDAGWQAHNAVLEVAPGELNAVPEDGRAALVCAVTLEAAQYNVLEVEMRVGAGESCKFSWRGLLAPMDPLKGENPSIAAPILGDNKFHTYTIPLVARENSLWADRIDGVLFYPSDVETVVAIRRFEFAFEPPESPPRVTLENVTMEAVYGSQPAWHVTVPQAGVFETHLGVLDAAWKDGYGGIVRFRGILQNEAVGRVVLFEKTLSPGIVARHRGWVPVTADLSAYAGQEVDLWLRVDVMDNPFGDYAFWGNPKVFGREREPRATPVILISCDTLRADHLSCYGYERKTTPFLDHWAATDAALFEQCIVQEPYTLPSHICMLTGLYPKHHGVNADVPLAENAVTLPELLAQNGYLAAGFTGHRWWLRPEYGFAQGFDYYDVAPGLFRHVHDTADRLYSWLGNHTLDRLFLFFHNYDMHYKTKYQGYTLPYDPGFRELWHFAEDEDPECFVEDGAEGEALLASDLLNAYRMREIQFTDAQHRSLVALYDDCILLVDAAIEEFFRKLRTLELYEQALIIVTSDHGESLDERGYYDHRSIYEEVVRVPLLVKFPGGEFAGNRFAEQVQSIDIFATVQDVLELPHDPATDGISLRSFLRGADAPREFAHVNRSHTRAIRTNVWKLHWNQQAAENPYRLFKLAADPYEREDLFGTSPPALAALEAEMRRFFPVNLEGWHVEYFAAPGEWAGHIHARTDGSWSDCLHVTPQGKHVLQELTGGDEAQVPIGEHGHESYLFRTASSELPLHLSVLANTPCQVLCGDRPPETGTEFSWVLDPEERYPRPSVPDSPPVPTVCIWRQDTAVKGEADLTPTEEQAHQLEALGYLE